MIKKCSSCKNLREICYEDYVKGFSLNLCWDCMELHRFDEERIKLIPQIKICDGCSCIYIPKKENSKKCGVCWMRFFGRLKEEKTKPKIIQKSKSHSENSLNKFMGLLN